LPIVQLYCYRVVMAICPCCSNIVQMIKEIASICLFFMVVQCHHVGISCCRMDEHRIYLDLMVHNQFSFFFHEQQMLAQGTTFWSLHPDRGS
jgi:hypothetical protein